MWNNAQKAIVNNFIMNRINDINQANENEHLGMEEIQEIYNNLAEMLDELFVLGNNNPANVDLFQDNFNLLDNDNNNDDDNIIEPDNQGEQSPTSVADPRLNGGKKRKRKTIKKRKSIQRRKSRRRKSSRRRK